MLTECVTGAYANKVEPAILTSKTENSTIYLCQLQIYHFSDFSLRTSGFTQFAASTK